MENQEPEETSEEELYERDVAVQALVRKWAAARDKQLTERNRADMKRIREAKEAGLPSELKVWQRVVENIDPLTDKELDELIAVLMDAKLLLELYGERYEGTLNLQAGALAAEHHTRAIEEMKNL